MVDTMCYNDHAIRKGNKPGTVDSSPGKVVQSIYHNNSEGAGNMAFDPVQYVNDYKRQNYDRIVALVPKGKGKVIKDYAKTQGKSVSQVVVEALESVHGLDLSK